MMLTHRQKARKAGAGSTSALFFLLFIVFLEILLPHRTTTPPLPPTTHRFEETPPTKRPRRNNHNDPTTITRPNGKMTLLSCPNEVILEIGGYLSPKDLNSLVLTNRLFYGILNERLYKLPPSDDALLHTIKNHRISTMKRFIDGGLDVNMSVPLEIYLPMLGSVTLLCYTIEWGSPYIARMLLEAGASADMCYISHNTATLGLGKLLWRFGAHARRPPPEIALRMVKSNHWNLGFNNEKLLVMAYPDNIVWFVLV